VIATPACQMTAGPGTECPRRGVHCPLREGSLPKAETPHPARDLRSSVRAASRARPATPDAYNNDLDRHRTTSSTESLLQLEIAVTSRREV
jgi:hypothetical protein